MTEDFKPVALENYELENRQNNIEWTFSFPISANQESNLRNQIRGCSI